MKIGVVFITGFCALATVHAATIDFDMVQPFAEPKPVSISQKAAVKFKPSLLVGSGCDPYPAVNYAGDTSGGLEETASNGDCSGSPFGSQVYSRSGWFNDQWAIMYAWYFPMDSSAIKKSGVRYDWINVIVWLDNPAEKNQTILGVSTSIEGTTYNSYKPVPAKYLDGTSTKVLYFADKLGYHTVDLTAEAGGDFQDLIHWSQLTRKARAALETADFGSNTPVPFNDANFDDNLKRGWFA
ncbi:necrosis inducing-like protein NPP1 type [Phytophthora cinnamomi]|uniref:necrosis inducing-like protein NPP1 type n=1 Tax=Phytophthora cinnamomi TaxID=4785 RepID=UPI00355A7636|nr:necrosis inducing-like protein NPP1 type [Phytophthora cinnamomi]